MAGRSAIITAGLGATVLAIAIASWAAFIRSDHREQITSQSIVMLGDSITEQGPWESAFPDLPIVNRGHPGFTTAELVDVAAEVAAANPMAVYVLTGTNDVRDDRPPAWTIEHLTVIVDELASTAPSTTVVLQTILPRSVGSEQVRETNDAITALAADRDLELIDLHAAFDDGAGALRPTDTNDGVHLSTTGNQRWAGLLRDHFDQR